MGKYVNNNIFTHEESSALKELKASLKRYLGKRTARLILYGSKARGDYNNEPAERTDIFGFGIKLDSIGK